jgi:hypothetical protein
MAGYYPGEYFEKPALAFNLSTILCGRVDSYELPRQAQDTPTRTFQLKGRHFSYRHHLIVDEGKVCTEGCIEKYVQP